MSTETEVKGGVGGTGWKNSETEEEMSMKQEDSECHKTTKATKQRTEALKDIDYPQAGSCSYNL